jgi:Family of unknown function (DUF6614)
MDIYHIWVDLKDGVSDLEFADAAQAYLGLLEEDGVLESYRITRRKLGLGHPALGEFHLQLEFNDMTQLDEAFSSVARRADPVESFHFAVNSKVTNFVAALYRDFPDEVRETGDEQF